MDSRPAGNERQRRVRGTRRLLQQAADTVPGLPVGVRYHCVMRGYHTFLAQVPTPVPVLPAVGQLAGDLLLLPGDEPPQVRVASQPTEEVATHPTDAEPPVPPQPRPA